MAINFNQDSAFTLKPINVGAVRDEIKYLLIPGENIEMAFQTVRDQLLFTDLRIIAIDVQGITGRRKSYSSLPYSKILYFTVQTPGFAEMIADSELFLSFSNGFTAKFEFKGSVDIGRLGRLIAEKVLQ